MGVVVQQWISVDGYASGLQDEGEIFAAVPEDADLASQRWNERLLDEVSVVLLGRRSYETFVSFWPDAEVPIAPRVNAIPKVVFSRTLAEAPWGDGEPAAVEQDAVRYVREARDRDPAQRLLVWGSLALMHELMSAGEVDELDLFVAPIALGAGTRLTPPGVSLGLTPVDSEIWDGVAHLRYAVTR